MDEQATCHAALGSDAWRETHGATRRYGRRAQSGAPDRACPILDVDIESYRTIYTRARAHDSASPQHPAAIHRPAQLRPQAAAPEPVDVLSSAAASSELVASESTTVGAATLAIAATVVVSATVVISVARASASGSSKNSRSLL